jgi:squalene synthase HpnC
MLRTMSGIEHYENFPVASWLCPPHLRPAILALYLFARTADDLADEGDASAQQRLNDLAQFRADLNACLHPHTSEPATSSTRWPQVFSALGPVVRQHQLPHPLLHDLLDAFEQDVVYTRDGKGYQDRAELLDYCRRSANPVGRLLLYLYGVHDATSLTQSDAICTALQLINFWQDLSIDVPRGRHYLPPGRSLLDELGFARALMMQGAPLVHSVPGRAGWELRAVVQGGLRILDKLDAQHAGHAQAPAHWPRPTLHTLDIVRMLWRTLWM